MRYALAPACVLAAVLVFLSPAGPTFSLAGLCVIAVLVAAWFGGAGPGFLAAVLASLAMPLLGNIPHRLAWGFLDVPRFITFSIVGLAVGWWSFRRRQVEAALRESEHRYSLAMAASESGHWDWEIPSNRYFASPRAFELSGFPPGTQWVNRDEYRANINMHPEDLARWEAAREELFAGSGERLGMEVRYIVDGETRWHSLQGICQRNANGRSCAGPGLPPISPSARGPSRT
jgi:PAS domain-containing protein